MGFNNLTGSIGFNSLADFIILGTSNLSQFSEHATNNSMGTNDRINNTINVIKVHILITKL